MNYYMAFHVVCSIFFSCPQHHYLFTSLGKCTTFIDSMINDKGGSGWCMSEPFLKKEDIEGFGEIDRVYK